jgi:uncharacterized membrane protein
VTEDQKDAIEQLERRVATLENMVRRLTFVATKEPARPPAPPAPRPAPLPKPQISAPQSTDLEQWFGQRGLLAVGVAALLVAAAFFLKYAFDRGWISPLLRSLLAIVSGIAVAAWGHERITQGMRRYGASLIGAGGGLVFLGLWAAAGPYALVERRVGILLLALTTVAVTLLALRHQIEGLAIWALAGAYLAPLLLRPPTPNADAFLGYLEVVGLGTGILAYGMTWRRTFNLALFGYLFLAAAGAQAALATPTGSWLVAAGVLLTLHVTHRHAWPEARVGVLLLAFIILVTGLSALQVGDAGRWLALAAPMVMTGVLFWQHMQRDPFRPDTKDAGPEPLLFVLSPVALVLLAEASGVDVVEREPTLVPATLAIAHLVVGWVRRSPSFLILGFGLAALAVTADASPANVTIGWTALALVALAAEREWGRPGGRYAALGLAPAAFATLFTAALSVREPQAPVFTDVWALALYAHIVGLAVAARWWGGAAPRLLQASAPEWLWALCGTAVFAGGSIQLARAFGRIGPLAGNLALSLWWLLVAGTLVWLGFRLERKAIRSAGLIVAAAAGLKIVLYDLSTLEALYRIASFFALSVIALAVAYAYNRRAKASAA